ncbi:flagellin [Photobacterium phosphoreum]|uniref:flagellin n=1 Tax=Photobacterium phosphoreum TaxID=659 RepID=UPI003F6C5F96
MALENVALAAGTSGSLNINGKEVDLADAVGLATVSGVQNQKIAELINNVSGDTGVKATFVADGANAGSITLEGSDGKAIDISANLTGAAGAAGTDGTAGNAGATASIDLGTGNTVEGAGGTGGAAGSGGPGADGGAGTADTGSAVAKGTPAEKGDFTINFATAKLDASIDGAVSVGGTTITQTEGTTTESVASLDLSTQANAQNAIDVLDAAMEQVDEKRAEIGAFQNRMTHTMSNLANINENVNASNSRIKDVDFASETINMTKGQILQQAGTSILAQAKQIPQAALSLLG